MAGGAPAANYADAQLNHLALAISKLTPLGLAEQSWDNVGLLVEAPKPRTVTGPKAIVCCIDLTTAVLEEALAHRSTSVILCYHPPIFSGLKKLSMGVPLQASILRCIAEGISIFCVHTAADNALLGVNDFIAFGLLKLETSTPNQVDWTKCRAIKLNPDAPDDHKGAGSGRLVDLRDKPLSRDEVVGAVKKTLGLKYLQAAWAPKGKDEIESVAICAGSGSSVLNGVPADCYITGELDHHSTLAANAKGIHVILTNHSASERPWLSNFAPRLQKAMNDFSGTEGTYQVVVSTKDREPLVVV
ncbi:hypothetical protein MNV49_003076 [Pseudohyphozyma bogoriensis]|nr:hypothetical protein MNV49_003076 [Pseudohyphozyma bogoriensis]